MFSHVHVTLLKAALCVHLQMCHVCAHVCMYVCVYVCVCVCVCVCTVYVAKVGVVLVYVLL